MKRPTLLLSVLAVLTALVLPVISTASVAAAGSNLIANPSVETASNNLPANWQASKWGTSTATLTYENTGRTGSKSLKASVTAHTDGDVKWMSAPVAVSPNTSYTYTDFYKSSVGTEIDLQYTDAAGNLTYAYVKEVPAATDWTEVSATFTTPATAQKVVVLHILDSVGTLQTDDFTLTATDTTPPVTPPTEPPAGTNLLPNPSFETAANNAPTGWGKNFWGTNTNAFSYLSNDARTGTKSAKVAITAYTSGDAKWFATPVSVTAGATYTYSDWYKSNIVTRVVAAFSGPSGTTYKELPTTPASATVWKQYTTAFTIPANTTKLAIYHLVSKVGTLTLDDASLIKTIPTPPAVVHIPNGSVETVSGTNATMPENWTSASWGANTPSFEYINQGRTGNKSIKVSVSNYTDGDAKWYFNPVTTLQKGKQYRFTTWYKTNVIPKAVAMFTKADGTQQYFGMPNPQPPADSSTVWQKYSDTFSVPQDAVSTSVFLFVNQNGWLQTDDYSITDYTPTSFNRSLLSLTFDDGHEDNVANALPVLNQYGFTSTQCFATSFIENNPSQATSNVMAFFQSGHEICSHSVTHPMLTSKAPADLTYELDHSQQYLQSIIGAPVKNFASPYGDYNANVNAEIKKYYRSHRTVDEGYNSKDNFDPYRIRVQNILATTSAVQVKSWVQQAQADKTWLVLVYHRIGNNPGPFDSMTSDFQAQMEAIKQTGIQVKSYNAALDELTAQL